MQIFRVLKKLTAAALTAALLLSLSGCAVTELLERIGVGGAGRSSGAAPAEVPEKPNDTPEYEPFRGTVLAFGKEDSVLAVSSAGGRSEISAFGFEADVSYYAGDMGFYSDYQVSLDGTKALLRCDDGASLYWFDGTDLVCVCRFSDDAMAGASRAQLSPDGNRVLYPASDGLYLWENGTAVLLTSAAYYEGFGFSADNVPFYTKLVQTDGSVEPAGYRNDGSGEIKVADGLLFSVSDGGRIAVSLRYDREADEYDGIYLTDLDRGVEQRICGGDEALVWFNRSQTEVLLASEEETWYVPEGGAPVRVADRGYEGVEPILPCGTSRTRAVLGVDTLAGTFLYVRGQGEESDRILRLDPGTGGELVVYGAEGGTAALAEDGRTLFVLQDGALLKVDGLAPDGARTLIARDVYSFAAAADGSRVFYVVYDSGAQSRYALYTAVPDGSDPLLVSDSITTGSIGEGNLYGGRYLVFSDGSGTVRRTNGLETETILDAGENGEFPLLIAGRDFILAFDFSTAPGESAFGSTAYLSLDGRTFENLGVLNLF